MSKNIGVILAGGVGSRMKLNYPKQFSKIAGKTALEHTIDIFQEHEQIDEIVIVAEPNHYTKITEIIQQNNYTKVNRIVYGGKERTDSTLSAIKSLEKEDGESKVIIHDAVRPLLAAEVISNCIQALDTYNAVDVCIPATDTIVKVDPQTQTIIEIPKRSEYYQGQTPQAFKLKTIVQAYEIYKNTPGMVATCDCGIVMKTLPQEKVYVVLGSETNIKLTRPVDLFIADKLFQSRSQFSLKNIADLAYLQNLKDAVIVVVGGSYGIGSDIVNLAQKLNLGIKTYALSRSSGVDVADHQALSEAFAQIYAQEGRIDCVVNTAATLVHKPLAHMDAQEVAQSINVNFTGVVNVATVAYPYLKESAGSLLNYTSSSYTRGRAFYSIYSATKAAIVNFTQAIADEWAQDQISINCINPERTKTPMRVQAFGIEPEGSLLNPESVALASLFVLASKESGNIVDVVRADEEYISKALAQLG
ncbi:bifunctional cytidylyltransferase/SDR family oxidoreductase [Psittacicella gerlachiana]|uniref:2-C-methyl-D-erythritol 4-phosphate cytidylyltransferase n=1 Tax=Psittacicella gerlachiana TaxID=2028574 RepID=A0A3A1YR30_9GAMM|nr:bifunctional cytidylyltransferase/SDR family oxidoreductase [Psittacicella gerlachiana]RIY38497.1 short-chain dehydrogenase [Psittacicella gerlachiana]